MCRRYKEDLAGVVEPIRLLSSVVPVVWLPILPVKEVGSTEFVNNRTVAIYNR